MMFETGVQYPQEIQDLINEIEEKQTGVQVIKVKNWALPLVKYKIELEISKAKNLNIIEEFILKIALANLGTEVTDEVIQEMLGLDEVFTFKFIQRLADAGVIDKKKLPMIEITPLGKQQFEMGQVLTKDRKESITAYVQPQFKLFYSKVEQQKAKYPLLPLEGEELLTAATIENDDELMEHIIDMAKEDQVIVNRESVNQFVSKVNSVTPMGSPVGTNFCEFWIYDLIEDQLYCRVWDSQKSRFNHELSEYITKTQPLTKEDFELKKDVPVSTGRNGHKYEEKFKEEVKAQRNEGSTTKLSLRMLRGAEIKPEFERCLKGAKKYLYIQSPWISDHVVDNEMLNRLRNLAQKNCRIFISWGIARDINREDRRPDQELLEALRSIQGPDGLPGVLVYWIGNHHNKEIIVDDQAHLAGSFNWLSYRGDYLPRGESVYITHDPSAIKDAKSYWEEQIFNKITADSRVEDYLRDRHALLNLETMTSQVKEVMSAEVGELFKQKDREAFVKLYNLALIYFKNKLFDEVFISILSHLAEHGENLREVYIILSYLKKNNHPEIHDRIIEEHQEQFIKAEILNEKLKPHKSLTKKSSVKELAFI